MSASSSETSVGASCSPTVNLSHCLNVAKKLAKEAGTMQVNAISGTESVSVKSKGGIDLVTDVDTKCEKLIFQALREEFPAHSFIGEESASDVELTDAPTWCVDPVDGTTNFVHQIPLFCVSIGLFIGKQPVMGVIYNASTGNLFSAIKGEGAFMNGISMHVDIGADNLPKAVVFTNFGHSRDQSIIQDSVEGVHELLKRGVRGIRMTGSCCLAMSHVARGWASCYYESDIGGLWDVCAGIVIVREAGGVVRRLDDGSDYNQCVAGKQRLICGNAKLVDIVLRSFSSSGGGEVEVPAAKRQKTA